MDELVEPPRHTQRLDPAIGHSDARDLRGDREPRAVVIGPRAGVGLSLEPRVDLGHVSVVEHVPDLGHPAALVEHEAVVVGGVDREGRAVIGVGDVLRLAEALARRARPDGSRHRVELVPDGGRYPRPYYKYQQGDDRDDQDVLDSRLPLRAAGKSRRYPPPKGISAAFMCGSSRIALADAAEDRHGPAGKPSSAAAAMISHRNWPTARLPHYTTTCLPTYAPASLPRYTATRLHAYRATRQASRKTERAPSEGAPKPGALSSSKVLRQQNRVDRQLRLSV